MIPFAPNPTAPITGAAAIIGTAAKAAPPPIAAVFPGLAAAHCAALVNAVGTAIFILIAARCEGVCDGIVKLELEV
ncbi:hypothetical protein RRF57_009873 [Xylaria bambusicola]|uniref:Uncharacterized protein n=1 Tax=Xylaria bambusicola TaxID=326684 RepID=A0AAN7Z271_9PEZI